MTPTDVDAFARAVLVPLADSALRAIALACLVGTTLVVLRKKGSALRLSTWTIVLYAALAMPVLGLVVPAWQWPVPTVGLFAEWRPAAATSVASVVAASANVTETSIEQAASLSAWLTAPVVAAAVYLMGVLLLSLHAGLGWLVSRRLRTSAQAITDAVTLARLARHAGSAGLARPPRLMQAAQLFVPVTMSVVDPIVALPSSWRAWSDVKLDAVLAHEVAHVARRDALTQRIALVYRAIFWCSPLSWWLHRHLSELAEQASDEAALAAGIQPAAYAETLLDFFADLQRGPRRAAWHLAMARGADKDAARRVERILSWKGGPIMTRSKWVLVGIALATLPVAALAASISPMPVPAAPLMLPALPATPLAAEMAAPVPPPVSIESTPPIIEGLQGQTTRTMPPPPPPPPPAPRATREVPPPPPPPPPPPELAQQSKIDAETPEEFARGAYEAGMPGLVAPRVLRKLDPKYTSDAMRAKIAGTVEVEMIVNPDGTVGKARVTQSLDRVYGLDRQALIAARQFTFAPGLLHEQPVPVHVKYTLEFRLH